MKGVPICQGRITRFSGHMCFNGCFEASISPKDAKDRLASSSRYAKTNQVNEYIVSASYSSRTTSK